ncbi:MAG: SRPBCC family protein [Prevotella sp.]|uniref:SRPBCC family protein n=1 Tax=Prevotella sp. TaxID=59823 RepID=UPI002585CC89|nr:SRPBCC family protein [Prevotella sp.]MDD6853250.1 SRPBCC family protein [Prevotella sp.]
MKLESAVKAVPHSQRAVYDTLSDLTHLKSLKDRIPAGSTGNAEMDEVKDKLQDLSFDKDSMSINISPVGNVSMRIVDREEPKMIKFESEKSPLKFKFWIQMLPVEVTTSKLRLTIDADVPFFAKGMVEKPLQEALEKIADMMAMIPYEE